METTPAPAPAPSDPGRTLRRTGMVLAGAGLAALGAATYCGLQIKPTKDEASRIAMMNPPDARKLEQVNARGDRYELLQWIFIGVGATAVTTGAVLTYLGLRTENGPASVRLTPVVAPRYAGASFALPF